MFKKKKWRKTGVIFIMLLLMSALTIADDLPGIKWLKEIMDQHHTSYAVYKDFISAGNNFSLLGQFGTATNMTVDANYTNSTYSGLSNNLSCIKVTYVPTTAEEYVGWYYLNGVSTSGTSGAVVNWGSYSDAGIDLTGSTNITFWAKGATGLEEVKFVALGVGRNPDTGAPTMPYCGSSIAVTTGKITLSSSWTKYTIDLSGKDLTYVLGGFGWSMEKPAGAMGTQVFYIDQIEYNGMDRSSEPRLLTSYKSIISDDEVDISLRNTAYTYDSCLAALAFLAVGEYERARNILDALVYVQNNDRYYTDGRIRNAYQSGNLALPNGWLVNGKAGCARMPGSWGVTNTNTGAEGWIEDRFAVSTDTGNIAWTMLAYITAYDILNDQKYLDAAKLMGDWVQTNNAVSNDIHIEYSLTTTNGGGYTTNTHVYEQQKIQFDGYSGQFDGWGAETVKHAYKSIEHNLDLYVVFQRLYDITTESKWLDRALVASNFSMKMWESTDKKFLVGTEFKYDSPGVTNQVIDGTTVTITITNYTKEVIDQTNHSDSSDEFHEATDAQAWMILALRLQNTDYTNALHYVVNNAKYSNTWGFDYNINKALWEGGTNGRVHPDAIWYEGTAQMATAFMLSGDFAIATNIVTEVTNGRAPSGGQPAAGPDDAHDKVSTGFWLPEGEWFYYRREHTGATSWAVIAEEMRNMFWIGTSDEFLDPGETFSHSSFSSTNTTSSSSSSSASNLLPNPSFETVSSDWTTEWSPGAPWVPTGWLQCQWNTTGNRTGTNGRWFYSVSMDNYMMIWVHLLAGSRPAWSPGKAARASVWFNTPADVGDEFYIEVVFMDENGVHLESSKEKIGKDDVDAAEDGWHELVVYTPHAPHGTTQLDVKIGVSKGYFNYDSFSAKFDDASLIEYSYDSAVGSKNYVVYSETTVGDGYFVYDWSGDLQVWNNLTVGSNITTQYEGFQSQVLDATAGDWFGMAITHTNGILDLSDFVSGSLNFAIKTSSTKHFKVGLIDSETNEMWVNFVNGDTNYGVIRDGSWHKVSIPMGDFFGITELKNLTTVFALAGEPTDSAVNIEIDDIYFSTTAQTNYANQYARLIKPANNATLGITGENFKWSSGIGVTNYRLTLGSSVGATDIYDESFNVLYRSSMIIDLPKDGSTVYARLYSTINGTTGYYDTTFTAGNATAPYTYMVMSETSGTESFYINNDGNVINAWIYRWGILAGEPTLEITENTNSVYEGSACVRISATNTNEWAWFGIGFMSVLLRDLSSFTNGTLNVALKTSSEDYFKIGIKDGTNESWIHFVSTTNSGGSNHAYGFVRDGNWHLLKIPMSHFTDLDKLTNINHVFMLAGESPSSNVVIDIDHINYDIASTTPTNFPAQIITPVNGSKLDITGVYFKWTHGAGITEYNLSIGTNGSYTNVYDESQGTSREAFVQNLPIYGETLNIRMGSKINGVWQYIDYMYTAGDVSAGYTYVLYSDTNTYDQIYRFDVDGEIQDWYHCLLGEGETTAYEGSNSLSASLQPAVNRSFGITAVPAVNMTPFTNGSLKFAIKTTTTEPFAIGFMIGDTQYNIGFTNGSDPYGLVRDGSWQSISIPVSNFGAPSLSNMTALFAFYGYKADTWALGIRVDVDDIKYEKPNLNTAPIITSTAVTFASASNAYSYDVDATDADSDTLTYSLLTNPTGMTINSSSGVISWTATSAQEGDNSVTVQVSDGNGGTDTQSFTINVVLIGKVYIIPLGNGDCEFSLYMDDNKSQVQLFAKQNGSQDYVYNPLVDTEVTNVDGTFTYSIVRKLAYATNDSIQARFYTYSVAEGQVFCPGPGTTFSDAVTNNLTGVDSITIENVGGGSAKFSVTVSELKDQVQIFAKKNGIQDYVNYNMASGSVTTNTNGTYTYYVTRDGSYSTGDKIVARFYTYINDYGVSQIYYPGPDGYVFSEEFTY